MSGVTLNGAVATSAMLSVPRTGVWWIAIELDLPDAGNVPDGRATVTIAGATLIGTVDPRATGRIGAKMHVEVVGGGGGWDRTVPAQHFHNDAGVVSTAVYSSTAATVGETLVDEAPVPLGVDYVRGAGAASRALPPLWYVDAAGVTHAGAARATLAASSDVQILAWEPDRRRAELVAESIVWPGTVLADARFGRAVVRDVEVTCDESGARTIAWCETSTPSGLDAAGSRLIAGLQAAARDAVGLTFLRRHVYRVAVEEVDGRLTLQSATRGGVVPDILQSVPVWAGVSAVAQSVALGALVLVEFIAGDPARPIVTAFAPDNGDATSTTIRAAAVHVGAGASAVVVASSAFIAWVNAVSAAAHVTAPLSFTSSKLRTD